MGAGAIYVATHNKKISQMGGYGWRMPITFTAFSVASLSMIGVPLACGFVTKWYLVNGAIQAKQVILIIALLASTILNASYFGPIIYRAFFMPAAEGVDLKKYSEPAMSMVIPLVLTSIMSVVLGLWPELFLNFVKAFGHF